MTRPTANLPPPDPALDAQALPLPRVLRRFVGWVLLLTALPWLLVLAELAHHFGLHAVTVTGLIGLVWLFGVVAPVLRNRIARPLRTAAAARAGLARALAATRAARDAQAVRAQAAEAATTPLLICAPDLTPVWANAAMMAQLSALGGDLRQLCNRDGIAPPTVPGPVLLRGGIFAFTQRKDAPGWIVEALRTESAASAAPLPACSIPHQPRAGPGSGAHLCPDLAVDAPETAFRSN